MNNAAMFYADRATHLKIVVVALIASIAVMAVVIDARLDGAEPAATQASAPVVKPAKPVMATTGTDSSIR